MQEGPAASRTGGRKYFSSLSFSSPGGMEGPLSNSRMVRAEYSSPDLFHHANLRARSSLSRYPRAWHALQVAMSCKWAEPRHVMQSSWRSDTASWLPLLQEAHRRYIFPGECPEDRPLLECGEAWGSASAVVSSWGIVTSSPGMPRTTSCSDWSCVASLLGLDLVEAEASLSRRVFFVRAIFHGAGRCPLLRVRCSSTVSSTPCTVSSAPCYGVLACSRYRERVP